MSGDTGVDTNLFPPDLSRLVTGVKDNWCYFAEKLRWLVSKSDLLKSWSRWSDVLLVSTFTLGKALDVRDCVTETLKMWKWT